LPASIDHPANTSANSVAILRFFSYVLPVQDRQRSALLLCQILVKAATFERLLSMSHARLSGNLQQAEKVELASSLGFESFLISRPSIPRSSVNETVAPTNAKGNAEGATKKAPRSLIFQQEINMSPIGRITFSPADQQQADFVSARRRNQKVSSQMAWLRELFTKTSLGSRSECST